jgi:hypothetical protein
MVLSSCQTAGGLCMQCEDGALVMQKMVATVVTAGLALLVGGAVYFAGRNHSFRCVRGGH